jgi:hypothetical protein
MSLLSLVGLHTLVVRLSFWAHSASHTVGRFCDFESSKMRPMWDFQIKRKESEEHPLGILGRGRRTLLRVER